MTSARTSDGKDAELGYVFGPFLLHSEIDLTALRLARGSVGLHPGVRVEVQLGRVDLQALGGSQVSAWVTAGPRRCCLEVPGLARFAVTDGSRVVVELEMGANMADVRGYLTAWVFGALCHQNGMLPLHASAVEQVDGVTAFLGNSGAGKSTLAAFLGRRGYRVCSDDICLLRQEQQRMGVVPVAEWLKLWRGTVEALGEPVRPNDRTYSDEDKYRIYRAQTQEDALLRANRAAVRHVVFVERAEAPVRLNRLSNAATLGRMFGNVYLGYCMGAMGIEHRVVDQCARVLATAQGWVLRVPTGFEHMPAVLDLLEQRLLGEQA